MIVNFFLENKLDYANIHDYTYLCQFFAAILGSYYSFYKEDVTFARNIIGTYFGIEILFIPFSNVDVWIHHVASLLSICYYSYYDFDFTIANSVYKKIFSFEVSSIFLCIFHYLKIRKKYLKNKFGSLYDNIFMLNNIIFIFCFCKWRLYHFYFDMFANKEFYNLVTSDESIITTYLPYAVTSSYMGLNLYWFYLIVNGILKRKIIER